MVWRDVLRVDGVLARYLRLEESMVVEGNEPYLRDLLHERVRSDTDLHIFPEAVMWPSPLWSWCLSPLRLELRKGSSSSSRDAQSWKLQQSFLAEQAKEAHRRDCAASRQRTKGRMQARQQEKERVAQDEERVARAEKKRTEDSEKLERQREKESAEKAKEENEELQRKLATLEVEKREQQAKIKAAEAAFEKERVVRIRAQSVAEEREAGEHSGKRKCLPRKCKQRPERQGPVPETVSEHRDRTTFRLDCVEIGSSSIEGKGLISKIAASEGVTLFKADLAEVGERHGYTPDLYQDSMHIAHKDNESAMLIDAGETMVATPGACIEDVKMSYIRAMNHLPKDKKEDVEGRKKDEMTANVKLIFGETARPRWYIPTALHLEYTQWYCCRVVTVKPILPGDELTFPYDWTPKHWAKATPSRTRVAGRG